MSEYTARERWVRGVEEIVVNMPGADIGFFSDSIWCGNKDVEAFLVEQPAEALTK
mgnify:CR=1 FL=1